MKVNEKKVREKIVELVRSNGGQVMSIEFDEIRGYLVLVRCGYSVEYLLLKKLRNPFEKSGLNVIGMSFNVEFLLEVKLSEYFE